MSRASGQAADAAPQDAPPGMDANEAWRVVAARDASYTGEFVYGVKTTGIYCRPGCGARMPLRRNVVFMATPDDAERAGFRACRRCHPRHAIPAAAEIVDRARAYLDARLDERVTLEQLGRAVGISAFHLQRTFKRIVGATPREYAQARRAERFKKRLRQGDTVSRAVYEAGYGSSAEAYAQGSARLGMTPGAYRAGGRGVRIHYAITESPLGRLLVGATERGVCSVMLGDDDDALEAALHAEYPHAELTAASDALRGWMESIVAYLRGDSREADIPVDAPGTTFQTRVWKALRAIPYGTTMSYRAVATSLGAPTAARAVARACATNRVALVIPCHRVVREGGALGGYRWGLERKRQLLQTESTNTEPAAPVGSAGLGV